MFAWGDGVADIHRRDLLAVHRSHGKLATLTAVRPRRDLEIWNWKTTGLLRS
jgi:NDP-sugar pyrophosphorylase family protein